MSCKVQWFENEVTSYCNKKCGNESMRASKVGVGSGGRIGEVEEGGDVTEWDMSP